VASPTAGEPTMTGLGSQSVEKVGALVVMIILDMVLMKMAVMMILRTKIVVPQRRYMMESDRGAFEILLSRTVRTGHAR
jgi:hypothetical protein